MVTTPRRWLERAGWAFAVGTAVHIFDHLRRGQGSVSDELYWLGNLALVIQVAVITLAVTGHRIAPPAAVVGGTSLALGFSAAHWLPEWSALSDPVWEIESWTWFSAIASTAEIAGALAIAVAGWAVMRAGADVAPASEVVVEAG